jgi:acetaldehyde dehydrogenase (acetylating)
LGGTALRAVISANANKIVAYVNGHRHDNMATAVQDGVTHVNLPGLAYYMGESLGAFCVVTHERAHLAFQTYYATTPFAKTPLPETTLYLDPFYVYKVA